MFFSMLGLGLKSSGGLLVGICKADVMSSESC